MNQISILIKPVGSLCNQHCDYCFYRDEAAHRSAAACTHPNEAAHRPPTGTRMSAETAHAIIDSVSAFDVVDFCFQGGEPTLAGLKFFRDFCEYAESKRGARTFRYSLQTNGSVLAADNTAAANGATSTANSATATSSEWIPFLQQYHFLVGLSLDGGRALHEAHRDNGSFIPARRALIALQKTRIPFSVLTVVTNENAGHAAELYAYFVSQGILSQQYIACLDSLDKEQNFLSPAAYGRFLCDLFDIWFADLQKGGAASIRYFESLFRIASGLPPEQCGLFGHCSSQLVVEADGSVYPCDFYCLPEYFLGNVCGNTAGDASAIQAEALLHEGLPFTYQSRLDEKCRACPIVRYCNGGCFREHKKYCESYKSFLTYAVPKIEAFVAQKK